MVKINFSPVIKWSGSKRSQADEIIARFPKRIKTYYEPFLGGGSIMRAVMQSDIQVDRFVCSDKNGDLIQLWQHIKEYPEELADRYEELWKGLNAQDDDKTRKIAYYNVIRKRFNEYRSPADFLFLLRTCANGMPRYNSRGEFNTSFHITRDGIKPETLRTIIREWSILLNSRDITFQTCSYDTIYTGPDDYLYLDPPYAATRGMYYGALDNEAFFAWIGQQQADFSLSFDGKCKDKDYTYDVPEHLYDNHIYLRSGNSSFRRVTGHSRDSVIYESLYVKSQNKSNEG